MMYEPLRILIVTNTFPPVAKGGYGEICADVACGLAQRGHGVTVLTGVEHGLVDGGGDEQIDERSLSVRRELDMLLAPWRKPIPAARRTEKAVRRVLDAGLDAALVWHMRGVLKPCLRVLHDAGIPVFYMLHDRWVIYERAGAFAVPTYRLDRLGLSALRNLLARPLARWCELRAPPIKQRGTVCFVSEWLRTEHERLGWDALDPHVIGSGVDLARFSAGCDTDHERRPVRLLYVGRLHPTKGLATAVEALALGPRDLRLTVAGHEDDPQYVQAVRARVTELGLEERVEWRGEVPREEIPRLLLEHDVFVYPSIGVESGWLGVLEGLAAGRLVVTSAPGAPRELVEDGINALLFDPNNPRDLAHALARVSSDQHLRLALRSGARKTALGHSLEAMTGAIEALVDERVRHGCGDSKPSGAKSRSSGVVG